MTEADDSGVRGHIRNLHFWNIGLKKHFEFNRIVYKFLYKNKTVFPSVKNYIPIPSFFFFYSLKLVSSYDEKLNLK